MMKNKLKTAGLILAFTIAAVAARSQELPAKFVVDKIVAVVGSSAILYSEVEQSARQIIKQRREQGYTTDRDPMNEALEGLMLQKLLYNQAIIDSVKVSTDDITRIVEDNVQELIRQKGSMKAVEEFYQKPIFDLKGDLRQNYVEMRYAQTLQHEIQGKVTITPGEVERFYRRMPKDSLPLVPEQYVYAHITKLPASIKEAKQRTRERLLEMRQRIAGGMRFDALARMYSEDNSSTRGGEMDPALKESFVAPFADALVKLRPGQVSEVVETQFGFHIIQLIDKNGDLYHCRHILLRPTYTPSELKATTDTLDMVVGKIRAGELTFEKAAADFSDDPYSKLNGGIVSNHELLELYSAGAQYTSTRFPKEELTPADYRIISTLKPGEISKAFMSEDYKGNEMAKIIKLMSIIPTHPANINEDYLALENLALREKQEDVFEKWLDKKIATMYVRIDDDFRKGDFQNKNWLK